MKILEQIKQKAFIIIGILVVYIVSLVVYDLNNYPKENFLILTSYIAAGMMTIIVFVIAFICTKMLPISKRIALGLIAAEMILTIITGISFVTSGFLVLSFMIPSAFIGTVCGIRWNKNL